MASKAAVAAALARLRADTAPRATSPSPSFPEAQWHTSERSRRCSWCRSKTAILVYEVRQIRRPERRYGEGKREVVTPAARWSTMSARCLDTVACKVRSTTAYEKRQKRSGNLRWAMSRFERADLPKGSCRWCGQPIVFVEGTDYRVKRRERHRGDEHEVGDRNCRREHDRTFAANPRELVIHRGDPCCVDCGEAEVWHDPGDGTEGWWLQGQWEADHVIPIEDGGPHTPVNIARRCVRCHREKTNRENAARRAKRRVDKAQPRA